ncbi:hypothetical protein B0T22DRAFT_258145 [Podospora appendiculata]|uniref:Mitotic apparatus protein p62 n=1 Tax=Podospora appendiculata TaxID=314037 RepID=A0AAE1C918_9PEZI|nr:hypothetical protein B0T22DRAFT_258145 [Podospora appendiculata]
MAPSQLIRIPRTDTGEDGAFILGEVTPTGSASKPLTVKLVATEGEEPYMLKLRHDRIGELRASNSPCSPAEWESILESILVKNEAVEGIEAGAEADAGKSLTITIRRRVAGINQRLGALTLNSKDDEAIQLFDWCGAAALERQKFREDLAAETAKATDLESRVTELKNQLDELIQSKKDREAEILEKMCGLLNEKKLKIREQQRLLSTAKIDPVKLAAMQRAAAAEAQSGRNAQASRPAKRKTRGTAASDSSSDDGFEKMDVDTKPKDEDEEEDAPKQDESESERETTDEDATGSEPDEDDEPVSRRSPPPARPAPASQSGKASENLTIHPRRKALSPAPRAASSPAAPADGSETESDDEL